MAEQEKKRREVKSPSFIDALIPVVTLVLLIMAAVYLFGLDATGGAIQVALILAAMVAGAVGLKNGLRIADIGEAAAEGVSTATGAIFILLAVGALIGTWSMSGTIATLVYYGIQFLNPNWFYVSSAIICAVIALSIGSSWTVAATIGVGLIAIAEVLGVSVEITAGAIISGSYFGDKLSPLSETTNLAPTVTGTDLFTHIRNMLPTTVPAIIIALIMYGAIGLLEEVNQTIDLTVALTFIESVYYVGLLALIPLVVVIGMALMRIPPTVTIMFGALTGGLMAVILQPQLVVEFAGDESLGTAGAMIKGVWEALANGFEIDTGSAALDDLVSRGGMSSMLGTIWLIISAMAFGGTMEYTGLIARLIEPIIKRAKSDRSIMISAGLTAIGINILAADQYMSIVLTGRMYKDEFHDRGVAPETLSRQIEDTATITSPLVPWNSCGAYMAVTLGVATIAYLPFAFFNLINPLISFIYDLLGIQIKHLPEDATPSELPADTDFRGVGGQPISKN